MPDAAARATGPHGLSASARPKTALLALPADLLAAVDQVVRKARSRNELVAMALRRELAAQQRAAIDAAFAAMAQEPTYQAEAQEIVAGLSSH